MKNYVFNVKEVAMLLRISEKTAYCLVREKKLFAVMVRGQYRIPASALEEFLKGGSSDGENKSKPI